MKGQSGGIASVSAALGNSDTDIRWKIFIVVLVAYAFFLRILWCAQVELLPEEAYYWNYSRHLDIGYLDHPPMVAWLIRLGTALFGSTEIGVRSGALVCGVVTAYFSYHFVRNVFGDDAAWVSLAFSQSLPFFFFSGMLMTPDAPLTAAWAAALFFLERALLGGKSSAWVGVGCAMGIGLLSKYSIALLGVAMAFFMVVDAPSRQWFRRPHAYVAIVVATVLFAPVLLWNAHHNWSSFVFQTSRRLEDIPRFSLHKLVASMLILLTPTGFAAVSLALCQAGPGRQRMWRFLRIGVSIPLAVFLVFSLRHEVKLDWTGAPLLCAIPLLATGLVSARAGAVRSLAWLRVAWPITFLLLFTVYSFGWLYLTEGVPGLGYSPHTELLPVEWHNFAQQIDAIASEAAEQDGSEPMVVGMDRYGLASELAFYSSIQDKAVATHTSWHLFGEMGLMYEQWFPAREQAGRPLLLVSWSPSDLESPRVLDRVSELGPVREGALMRGQAVVRLFYYRLVRGYRPL